MQPACPGLDCSHPQSTHHGNIGTIWFQARLFQHPSFCLHCDGIMIDMGDRSCLFGDCAPRNGHGAPEPRFHEETVILYCTTYQVETSTSIHKTDRICAAFCVS